MFTSDTVTIDSLSIVPASLIFYNIDGKIIDKKNYTVDYAKSAIILKTNSEKIIKISYRVFPYNFSKSVYNKKYDTLIINGKATLPYRYKKEREKKDDFFSNSNISKSGSISRGITVGNNQDATVNSELNLQLAGKISSDISILAAVSDDNIPIQPEGTSQNIREFDKVYIQLFTKKSKLTAGDFEINKPEGYFINLNKKVQGASFETIFKMPKKTKLKSSLSGAVAKGKFNRLQIKGTEGNQGPYKLSGANNENYIVVLSGSEKVYIDGELTERGNNFDYIIDYNAGEITFTSKRLITKDKRIIIEFEYSERYFVRFTASSENVFTTKKAKFYFNFFMETDDKNQTIQQDFSDENKLFLSSIGDNLQNAIIQNVSQIDTFVNDEILYRRTDSTISGNLYDDIYIYSTNPEVAVYRLGFSYVGKNNGNYIRIKSNANGKVYQWTEPVKGIPQGDYEPVKMLVSPKKKQIFSFGGNYNLNKLTSISYETAYTNNDLNTFSEKDAEDDKGFAMFLKLKLGLLKKDTSKISLTANVSYFFTHKYFNAAEPYRDTEFARNWNMTENNIKTNENMLNFSLNFKKQKTISGAYMINLMNRQTNYKAVKNKIQFSVKKQKIKYYISGGQLISEDTINNTNFIRYEVGAEKFLKFINIGLRDNGERNIWKNSNTDSLQNNSYMFNTYEFFAKSPENFENKIFLSYKNRKDFNQNENEMNLSSASQDFNIRTELLKNKKNIFKTGITYRKLNIEDSTLTENKPEKTLTGRVENSLKLFKGAIMTSSFLEHGTGLEIKKEYSYIKVQSGSGVFAWKDFNNNNIKELNEFVISNFSDEAEYIKIVLPSEEFEKVYNQSLSQTLQLNPKRIWYKEKGLRGFASFFSDKFIFKLNRKINENEKYYKINVADTGLISYLTSIRNTFSCKLFGGKTQSDYIYMKQKNKIMSLNGADTRLNVFHSFVLRQTVKDFIFINEIKTGNKNYSSFFFSENDYKINIKENKFTGAYKISSTNQAKITFKINNKVNTNGNETLKGIDLGGGMQLGVSGKSNLSVKFNFIKLSFSGEENTSISYEILEGLEPGKNYLWSTVWQKNISKHFRLELNYQGRKTENNKIIHTGGMQLKAIF